MVQKALRMSKCTVTIFSHHITMYQQNIQQYENILPKYSHRLVENVTKTPPSHHLVEAASSEVVSDDDIGDSVEHELDILCVGGAGHVAVDFLRRALVLGLNT